MSTKPSDVLVAKACDDGKIILRAKGDKTIRIIGSTIPIDKQYGVLTDSFVISPSYKQGGIVFLEVIFENNSAVKLKDFNTVIYLGLDFILEIFWTEGRPYINLEKQWTPPSENDVKVFSGSIFFKINGEELSTLTASKDCTAGRCTTGCCATWHRFIPFPDMVLRWLYGEIKEKDILANVFQVGREWNTILELTRKYEKLEQYTKELENHAQKLIKVVEKSLPLFFLRGESKDALKNLKHLLENPPQD